MWHGYATLFGKSEFANNQVLLSPCVRLLEASASMDAEKRVE